MKNKYDFVWIEDDAKRASSFKNALKGSLRNVSVDAEVEIIEVTKTLLDELDDRANKWQKKSPDLILLDHNFTNIPKLLFNVHGSTIAHLLRLQLSKIPIVCVTAQSIDSNAFNVEDLSEYTYLFKVGEITSEANLELLFAIAEDFKQLSFYKKRQMRTALVDILNPPEWDRTTLLSVLPEEFEETSVHGTTPHRIARWILNILMKRQGFLCDALEAATFIGLTEKAFIEKVQELFEAALYTGPFATKSRPMWWASALTNVLYEKLPHCVNLMPQYAGRQFDGIVEDDYSRCIVTGNHTPAPDVVAYRDATRSARCSVQSCYTIPEPTSANSLLGFSTRLMIRKNRKGGK